ncbi:hypothetical protein GUF76_17565 [Xanthomonas citri pv. citri]|nr:hypothetical protein [Xanthomonas citri pv. citri]
MAESLFLQACMPSNIDSAGMCTASVWIENQSQCCHRSRWPKEPKWRLRLRRAGRLALSSDNTPGHQRAVLTIPPSCERKINERKQRAVRHLPRQGQSQGIPQSRCRCHRHRVPAACPGVRAGRWAGEAITTEITSGKATVSSILVVLAGVLGLFLLWSMIKRAK